VAALANYDAVKTVIGAADMSVLLVRIADRLRTVSGGRKIYRATDTALAWNVDAEHYELDDTLNGLKAVMRSPIEVAGRRIDAHPTFGVAEAGAVAEALHAAALATKEGRSWRYHQHAERAVLEEQVSLMGELDQAIERGELEVLYQPKLDLRSDQTASVEALVRWNHPERGMLRPDSFIPLAEQSDRIAGLTLYVLRTAIADLRDWCERGLVLKTAVNISARLISSPQFVSDAASMLLAADLLRERIIFEVTESATMDDPDAAVAALHRFRELGIAISMDDYGTGQSSLTYLRNLPLSELKIDRSFVQFAHRDRNDSLLVRSTVQLAHSLDLQVVAEGVEDEECLAFLRRIGCDLAQGYHIGRPMDAAQLRAYLLDEEQRAA
jgi:EAL domain-containing protein (putative c-di-GMP-specific phosphodiesterase class I)